MGSRRKPPDRRAARKPDISLMALAFDLPTPQDLRRQADHRIARLARIAQSSGQSPQAQQVPSRNVSTSTSPMGTGDEEATDILPAIKREPATKKPVIREPPRREPGPRETATTVPATREPMMRGPATRGSSTKEPSRRQSTMRRPVRAGTAVNNKEDIKHRREEEICYPKPENPSRPKLANSPSCRKPRARTESRPRKKQNAPALVAKCLVPELQSLPSTSSSQSSSSSSSSSFSSNSNEPVHRVGKKTREKTREKTRDLPKPSISSSMAASPPEVPVQNAAFAPAFAQPCPIPSAPHCPPSIAHKPLLPNLAAPTIAQQYPVFAPVSNYYTSAMPQHQAYPLPTLSGPPNDVQIHAHGSYGGSVPSVPFESTSRSKVNFLTELHRIQQKMDQARQELEQTPNDDELRKKLETLQHELNSTLNNATAKNGSSRPDENVESSVISPPGCDRGRLPSPDRQSAKASKTSTEAGEMSQKPAFVETSDASGREQSPDRVVWHHLCSVCGDVRSHKFHHKHPLVPGQKPLLNYCVSCKEDLLEGGIVTKRHHFCFGCGVVRSKAYQRQHPAVLEQPLLPNYCGRCQKEVRAVESIADISVVNLDVKPNQDSHVECSEPVLPGQHGQHGHSTSQDSLEESAQGASPGLRERRRAKQFSKPSVKEVLLVMPVCSSEQAAPFCPDRGNGSGQRRVQRGTTGRVEPSTSPRIPSQEKPVYQRPYVEEARTTILRGSPGSESLALEGDIDSSHFSSPVSPVPSTGGSVLACVSAPDDSSSAVSAHLDDESTESIPDKESNSSKRVTFNLNVETFRAASPCSDIHYQAPNIVGFETDVTDLQAGSTLGSDEAERQPELPSDVGRSMHESQNPGSKIPSSPSHHVNHDEKGSDGYLRGSQNGGPASGSPFTPNFWAKITAHAGSPPRRSRKNHEYDASTSQNEGFPPDFEGVTGSYSGPDDGFDSFDGFDGSCSFRSSRGAFSSAVGQDYCDSMARGRRQHERAYSMFASPFHFEDSRSTRRHRGSFSPLRSEARYADNASSRSQHESRGFGSFPATRQADTGEKAFGAGGYGSSSASSGTSSNPYYKPSRWTRLRNDVNSQSRWPADQETGSSEPPSSPSQKSSGLPMSKDIDCIPEPVIEEPDSPPRPSPIRQVKLLEYRRESESMDG